MNFRYFFRKYIKLLNLREKNHVKFINAIYKKILKHIWPEGYIFKI